jgi:hypothetical protein
LGYATGEPVPLIEDAAVAGVARGATGLVRLEIDGNSYVNQHLRCIRGQLGASDADGKRPLDLSKKGTYFVYTLHEAHSKRRALRPLFLRFQIKDF